MPQLLLIGTYRTDELQRGHPLRAFLAELDRVRGVQRHEVDRLDRDGTAELLTQLLGVEPTDRTVDSVNERAQGNPFFIEQFASAGDPGCSDIPTSLRDLLLSRVDQLSEPAQQVLRVAAVGGTQFGHELLARVAGLGEAALESELRAIVAAQLIVFDPDGGYEFRHALVREAVHDDLLPGSTPGCTGATRRRSRPSRTWCRPGGCPPSWPITGTPRATIRGRWWRPSGRPTRPAAASPSANRPGSSTGCSSCGRMCRRPRACSR
ncbi:ATP-binding protein [Paractinoplanes durhamensis]|uniref:ATP-binding protein n=1 Tax=Paractinoplanes durhamensis TaxID=113563 RepID=UPI0036292B7E